MCDTDERSDVCGVTYDHDVDPDTFVCNECGAELWGGE